MIDTNLLTTMVVIAAVAGFIGFIIAVIFVGHFEIKYKEMHDEQDQDNDTD